MPGAYGLRCAECGTFTPYSEMRKKENMAGMLHKPDCSQQGVHWPKTYITKQLQAENPSEA